MLHFPRKESSTAAAAAVRLGARIFQVPDWTRQFPGGHQLQ